MWPIVAPNIALLFEHYEQYLRINTVFVGCSVDNLAGAEHSCFFLATSLEIRLVCFWIFVIFRNADKRRIVIFRVALCAELLNIFCARYITVNLLRSPHIASWRMRVDKRVYFGCRHCIRVVENRVVDNTTGLKFCCAESLRRALATEKRSKKETTCHCYDT